jgi:hypothetical protein
MLFCDIFIHCTLHSILVIDNDKSCTLSQKIYQFAVPNDDIKRIIHLSLHDGLPRILFASVAVSHVS